MINKNKLHQVNHILDQFHRLLWQYSNFYNYFGDYNFRHYASELYEKIFLISAYNDTGWHIDGDSYKRIEFDDSSVKLLDKLRFTIFDHENMISTDNKLDSLLILDNFDKNGGLNLLIYSELGSNNGNKSFIGKELAEYKIYAYLVD